MTDENYTHDIEETDELLESNEGDPFDFWQKKQRELLTSVVDYNLPGLADLVKDRAIDLNPAYQRRLRWDKKRQSKLIESFLMNVPVPPIFLNEDDYGSYSVIDGKQRITSISDFMNGRLRLEGLEVFHEINHLTFDEFPPVLQRVVKTRPTIRAVIILRQSDSDVKFNVFQRLNTGGVRLNAQEIRNSAFPGSLNNLILELSTHTRFHRLLGISSKHKSAIYQEMRDAEFVLRYFTFRDVWPDFSGGMKRQMDRFMDQNGNLEEAVIANMRTEFLNAVEVVEAAFGTHAFHRWMPSKRAWRKQVLAALYDAEMFALGGLSVEEVMPKQTEIVRGLQLLFDDPHFRQSVDAATNTPSYFGHRIRAVEKMVETIVRA